MRPLPPASTTPASRSTGQQIGRARDRVARGVGAAFEQRDERRRVERLDRLRDRAHDGEDRALDRTHHRFVRGVGRVAEAAHELAGADRLVVAALVGEAAQDLRQDHARVAAGAHERAAADRVAHVGHRLRLRQRRAHRLEGERHVGAGVAVGNRVHVEPVQLLLVRAHGVAEAQEGLAQIRGPQARQRRHPGQTSSPAQRRE